MKIIKQLESIKKTFQEYNLDLKRINEVIKDVEKLEKRNQDLKESNSELLKRMIFSQKKLEDWK